MPGWVGFAPWLWDQCRETVETVKPVINGQSLMAHELQRTLHPRNTQHIFLSFQRRITHQARLIPISVPLLACVVLILLLLSSTWASANSFLGGQLVNSYPLPFCATPEFALVFRIKVDNSIRSSCRVLFSLRLRFIEPFQSPQKKCFATKSAVPRGARCLFKRCSSGQPVVYLLPD